MLLTSLCVHTLCWLSVKIPSALWLQCWIKMIKDSMLVNFRYRGLHAFGNRDCFVRLKRQASHANDSPRYRLCAQMCLMYYFMWFLYDCLCLILGTCICYLHLELVGFLWLKNWACIVARMLVRWSQNMYLIASCFLCQRSEVWGMYQTSYCGYRA